MGTGGPWGRWTIGQRIPGQEPASLTTHVHGAPHVRGHSASWTPMLHALVWPVVSRPLAPGLCSGQALDLGIFLFLLAVCPTKVHSLSLENSEERAEYLAGLQQPLTRLSPDTRVAARRRCPAVPAVRGWPWPGHCPQPGGEASVAQSDQCNRKICRNKGEAGARWGSGKASQSDVGAGL